MKHLLTGFALLLVVALGITGLRGGLSRRPPIELFPDMVRQPKLRPQTPSGFFADGRESRGPVPGTVAHDSAYEDLPVHTGKVPGTTNFVELSPVPASAELLARGRERFTINCSPCHGAQGDGRGIATKYGMTVIGNFHDPRIVRLPDGEIFNTIANGKNLMQGYGANVPPADRWAIVAYVRALQLSHLGIVADVPPERRSALP
jgi:hypothetical protein